MNDVQPIIEEIIVDGDKFLRLISGDTEMRITKDYGPRIAYFGKLGGENLLYWNKEEICYGDWKLYGGHRVWLTRPFADESEDTYHSDNEPCLVNVVEGDVILEAPPNGSKIVRGMKICITEDGTFKVTGFLRNEGIFLYSAGVWSPTCINPEGGKVFGVSIGNPEATWDAVKIVIPTHFAGNRVLVNDEQITFSERYMIVHPKGRVSKRCLYSAKGIIAMNWPEKNLSFTKKVDTVRGGNYQLGGCNMAIFIGDKNFMVEMETYGEEKSIYPGETLEHVEQWSLKDELISFTE